MNKHLGFRWVLFPQILDGSSFQLLMPGSAIAVHGFPINSLAFLAIERMNNGGTEFPMHDRRSLGLPRSRNPSGNEDSRLHSEGVTIRFSVGWHILTSSFGIDRLGLSKCKRAQFQKKPRGSILLICSPCFVIFNHRPMLKHRTLTVHSACFNSSGVFSSPSQASLTGIGRDSGNGWKFMPATRARTGGICNT